MTVVVPTMALDNCVFENVILENFFLKGNLYKIHVLRN